MNLAQLDAILMDLDGVITETAKIHAQAWKRMFDKYLRERAARLGGTYEPFDLERDYKTYVDGKPRYDGMASFLRSRGIYLPPGEESDPPHKETICGLGNRKNKRFLDAIRQRGVEVYQTSIDFIRRVKSRGLRVAVVTSSRNCREVLEAVGISDLFDARVDGIVAREWMLDGKPAPDTYLEAARRLGVKPRRAAVIEDAVSGVQAGKAGIFGLVVGICRNGQPELLQQSGADIVVSDLSELRLGKEDYATNTIAPLALENLAEIRARIQNRRVAVFLDYDGTLTPIVDRPDLAVLSSETRATLQHLAKCCTVAIVSGRDLHDVENLVRVEGIFYAGSHGFRVSGPGAWKHETEHGTEFLPILDEVEQELRDRTEGIPGALIERKNLSIAVHYRLVSDKDAPKVEAIVNAVRAAHPKLRKSPGKKVFDLQPDIDWDKGKAVLWLLEALGLDRDRVLPVYIGDDVTDEDAFKALSELGIGIVVMDTVRPTAARYVLRDPDEVRRFLEELIRVIEGGTS